MSRTLDNAGRFATVLFSPSAALNAGLTHASTCPFSPRRPQLSFLTLDYNVAVLSLTSLLFFPPGPSCLSLKNALLFAFLCTDSLPAPMRVKDWLRTPEFEGMRDEARCKVAAELDDQTFYSTSEYGKKLEFRCHACLRSRLCARLPAYA